MSQHILISPRQPANERWRKAFADGQIVEGIQDAQVKGNGHSPLLWLDVSRIDEPLRGSWLQKAILTGCSVVVMNSQPQEAEAFAMVRQGAMGYCHAQAAPKQLHEIALAVNNGGLWLGADLLQRFLNSTVVYGDRRKRARSDSESMVVLTDRERAVGIQVAQGANNKEIAETLEITERTVKAHLSTIFDKLQVRDRVQLALLLNNSS